MRPSPGSCLSVALLLALAQGPDAQDPERQWVRCAIPSTGNLALTHTPTHLHTRTPACGASELGHARPAMKPLPATRLVAAALALGGPLNILASLLPAGTYTVTIAGPDGA
eukprot:gene11288-2053_t